MTTSEKFQFHILFKTSKMNHFYYNAFTFHAYRLVGQTFGAYMAISKNIQSQK